MGESRCDDKDVFVTFTSVYSCCLSVASLFQQHAKSISRNTQKVSRATRKKYLAQHAKSISRNTQKVSRATRKKYLAQHAKSISRNTQTHLTQHANVSHATRKTYLKQHDKTHLTQHAKRISRTNLFRFKCCHTDTETADQTRHLTQSQFTDTRTTSPNTDLITPGA